MAWPLTCATDGFESRVRKNASRPETSPAAATAPMAMSRFRVMTRAGHDAAGATGRPRPLRRAPPRRRASRTGAEARPRPGSARAARRSPTPRPSGAGSPSCARPRTADVPAIPPRSPRSARRTAPAVGAPGRARPESEPSWRRRRRTARSHGESAQAAPRSRRRARPRGPTGRAGSRAPESRAARRRCGAAAIRGRPAPPPARGRALRYRSRARVRDRFEPAAVRVAGEDALRDLVGALLPPDAGLAPTGPELLAFLVGPADGYVVARPAGFVEREAGVADVRHHRMALRLDDSCSKDPLVERGGGFGVSSLE